MPNAATPFLTRRNTLCDVNNKAESGVDERDKKVVFDMTSCGEKCRSVWVRLLLLRSCGVAWDRSWAEVYPGVRTRKTNHRVLRCLCFTGGGGLCVKLRGARCSMVLTSGLRYVRWCFLEVACRTFHFRY